MDIWAGSCGPRSMAGGKGNLRGEKAGAIEDGDGKGLVKYFSG